MPLLFDMPYEDLLIYEGTNPRPHDFDDYWDSALTEMMFHGYSMNSGDWLDKLPYVAAGFTVAALDCRGQGGRSEDPGGVQGWTLNGHIVRGLSDDPTKLLYRAIFLDTVAIAATGMIDRQTPDVNVLPGQFDLAVFRYAFRPGRQLAGLQREGGAVNLVKQRADLSVVACRTGENAN